MYIHLTEQDREIISRTVGKLPADVQEHVDQCCEFLCIDNEGRLSLGSCTSTYAVDYFIILGPRWRELVNAGKHEFAEVTIVHEIAHAWLRESEKNRNGLQDNWEEKAEIGAWLQIAAWGWDTENIEGFDEWIEEGA